MATIVELEDENQEEVVVVPGKDSPEVAAEADKQEPDAKAEPQESEGQQKEAQGKDDEEAIPAKFRGKGLKDIIKSYEQLESLVGRQGAELGELRRTHDEFIKAALAGKAGAKSKPDSENGELDEAEFFLNPKEAIKKAVEAHPLVRTLTQQQQQLVAEQAQKELSRRQPDWQAVMREPEFQAFVASNPVFGHLLVKADREFDVSAAEYVLSQYKQQRAPARNPAVDEARKEAVDSGRVPAGGAPQSPGAGKVYNRAALVRKMQTDPEWYEANADEILRAYQEGRVR